MLILGVECRAMRSDCAPPAPQKLRSFFYIFIKETGFVLWSRRQEYQFLVGKQFEIAVIQEEKPVVDGFCTHCFLWRSMGGQCSYFDQRKSCATLMNLKRWVLDMTVFGAHSLSTSFRMASAPYTSTQGFSAPKIKQNKTEQDKMHLLIF